VFIFLFIFFANPLQSQLCTFIIAVCYYIYKLLYRCWGFIWKHVSRLVWFILF